MTIKAFLGNLARAVSPFHSHVRYPNVDHLDDPRKRVFRAPLVHAQRLLQDFLLKDPQFRKAAPQFNQPYVLIFAVVGEQIRANFYRVEEDPEQVRIYDPKWHNAGDFIYLMDHNKGLELVVREMPGVYYCPDDVVRSYARDLTPHELTLVNEWRMHSR